jgi:hypothetical protein
MESKERKSKGIASRRSKKSKSLAIDDGHSSHVQGTHFPIESVLADLGKLTFPPSQEVQVSSPVEMLYYRLRDMKINFIIVIVISFSLLSSLFLLLSFQLSLPFVVSVSES